MAVDSSSEDLPSAANSLVVSLDKRCRSKPTSCHGLGSECAVQDGLPDFGEIVSGGEGSRSTVEMLANHQTSLLDKTITRSKDLEHPSSHSSVRHHQE